MKPQRVGVIDPIKTEVVYLDTSVKIPEDYHCNCSFCRKFLGLLIRPDGTKYSSWIRRRYYSREELKFGAKTSPYLARWGIQNYSKPGGWILDSTMGCGTTAVEALNHGRNVVGVELEFGDLVEANVTINNPYGCQSILFQGDARDIGRFLGLDSRTKRIQFDLIINNPPYSGDMRTDVLPELPFVYSDMGNLAYLGESEEYYEVLEYIYNTASEYLIPGGVFIIGVKDMMRSKKPYSLHKDLAMMLDRFMEFVGMVLLPHYPPTLFMNTYQKRYPGVKKIPRYQTLIVFRKRR